MIVDRLRLDGKQGLMIGAGGHGMGSATTLALAQAGATGADHQALLAIQP